MVSENLLWYTEPNNDLVENEIKYHFNIDLKGRHFLYPLRKVVYNDNDVLMPPAETGL